MSVVIIPAYKPDETLITITGQLWAYGCQMVVVDDGSGKEYQKIFDQVRDICIVLHHLENYGKGAAIKTVLAYIKNELCDSRLAGTMDCDGQQLIEKGGGDRTAHHPYKPEHEVSDGIFISAKYCILLIMKAPSSDD